MPFGTSTIIPLTHIPRPFAVSFLYVRHIFMNAGYVYNHNNNNITTRLGFFYTLTDWLRVNVCFTVEGGRVKKETHRGFKELKINLPDLSCVFSSSSWRQRHGTLSPHAGPKQSLIHPGITTSGHAYQHG